MYVNINERGKNINYKIESEDGKRRQKENLNQENENIVSDARREREM